MTNSVVQAASAAEAWLGLMDAGSYAPAWQAAATYFQQQIALPAWEEAAGAGRGPLKALHGRVLHRASEEHHLPGAPEGDYVLIQYLSRFDGAEQAVETVAMQREDKAGWKAVGYYIS
ncbi:DUF4019 domain-containing protein [uncultured Aquitalea sp.]|uniref:DUF4019 domain-containing protein n=1 Tax=uncultured Aquitalea sp. TaxID=540272 RepID=UPI0025F296D2|nr:DUF4019 domain-containing protein [uncultured Aquitalea sp.]